MTHKAQPLAKCSLNPVALSSYSVAICSFGAAVLGLPFSHWPSAALAGVGGFYLVTGLISRAAMKPAFSIVHEISQQTAGAENLVAEAIGMERQPAAKVILSPELVAIHH